MAHLNERNTTSFCLVSVATLKNIEKYKETHGLAVRVVLSSENRRLQQKTSA